MRQAAVLSMLCLTACRAAAPADQAAGRTIRVTTADELRAAIGQVQPGDRVVVAPGEYPGGLYAENLRGAAGRPVVIAAEDPARRPWFVGGANGLHLPGAAYLELRGLGFRGQTSNGLNLDDGGRRDGSAHHLTLVDLAVEDVGEGGNHDGLKLSGLVDFRIEGCRIERWGERGGSAIDMVGCSDGWIVGCLIRGREGETGNTGIQGKGNTTRVVIRGCRFEHAGARAVNLGGSTGLDFFRPPLQPGREHSEASAMTVEGCVFHGSMAPIAFVGVDGSTVRYNTIYHPARWVVRILQETTAAGFVPSRRGVFERNLVIVDGALADWVNIGPNTAPESFVFRENAWSRSDRAGEVRPTLPAAETGGVYDRAPVLANPAEGDLRQTAASPLRGYGAEALPAG